MKQMGGPFLSWKLFRFRIDFKDDEITFEAGWFWIAFAAFLIWYVMS